MQKQSFAMLSGEAIYVTMRFAGVENLTAGTVTTSGVSVSNVSFSGNAITTLLTATTPGWSDVKFVGTLADGQRYAEVLAVLVT